MFSDYRAILTGPSRIDELPEGSFGITLVFERILPEEVIQVLGEAVVGEREAC